MRITMAMARVPAAAEERHERRDEFKKIYTLAVTLSTGIKSSRS
ncbi:hypothetical protein [Mycobacterium paragordonae]|nr:hypothetical protein [Mycobacterium paragordonae]